MARQTDGTPRNSKRQDETNGDASRDESSSGEATLATPRVRVLSDEPAPEDEFGGHERVSTAMADVVSSEATSNSVGLEGGWGSGKSTVVRILESKLSDLGSDIKVFVFDAWAHQGDPLRRSFLETLHASLKCWKWIRKGAWDKKERELSGRLKHVKSTSTSRLTFAGYIAAITTSLIPIGAVLANENIKPRKDGTLLVLGFILALAPIVAGVVLGAIAFVAWSLQSWGVPGLDWLARIRPWDLFAQQRSDDVTTESVESGDPTSVEFERYFESLVGLALKDGDRRLVLIFDNLDRVDVEQARSILATMQPFMTSSRPEKQDWMRRLWTVVPYDPTGLERLWPAAGEVATTQGAPLAGEFADKVFEVRFQAPPLVTSDWHAYLEKLLNEALPDESSDELNSVVRLCGLYWNVAQPGDRPDPTPRELKQAVNQIGAIWRQYASGVRLTDAAYYILLRRDKHDVRAGLLSGKFPAARLMHILGGGADSRLAAINFNTDPENAQQLLLATPITSALLSGDSERARQLSTRTGAAQVIDALPFSDWAADGAADLSTAVATLRAAELFDQQTYLRATVVEAARNATTWGLPSRASGQGIAYLFDALTDTDEELRKLLGQIDLGWGEEGRDVGLVNAAIEGLVGLFETLGVSDRDLSGVRITVPLNNQQVVAALGHFAALTTEPEIWARLETSRSPDELSGQIVGTLGQDSSDGSDALRVLMARPDQVALGPVAESAAEWLRNNDAASAEILDLPLSLLDQTRNAVPDPLLQLSNEGHLLHHFEQGLTNGWPTPAARASLLHLIVQHGLPETQPTRLAMEGIASLRRLMDDPGSMSEELRQAQATWLSEQTESGLPFLLEILDALPSSKPWVAEMIRRLRLDEVLKLQVDQYLSRWELIRESFEEDDFDSLTAELLVSTNLTERLVDRGDSDVVPIADAVLRAAVTGAVHTKVRTICAWVGQLLEAATEDEWKSALLAPSGGPILDLAIRAQASCDPPVPTLGGPFENAVSDHAVQLARAADVWKGSAQQIGSLLALVVAADRDVLAQRICGQIAGIGQAVTLDFVERYGALLPVYELFRQHHEFISRVAAAFVEAPNPYGLSWVAGIIDEYPDTVSSAHSQSVFLRNRITERMNEMEEDAPESLEELRSRLPTE